MAIKDKIMVQRDLHLERINKSKSLTNEEKISLTGLVVDAAEGTNGLTEHDKIQNVSETTFLLATAMVNLTEQLNENNSLTAKVAEKIDGLEKQRKDSQQKYQDLVEQVRTKRDIKNLDWKDTMKLVLVKPWFWIFLAVTTFSPKGLEIIQLLLGQIPK